MKTWLRRWLMSLLADDIEARVNAALVDSECRCSSHDEDIQRALADQNRRYTQSLVQGAMEALSRQRSG